MIDFKICPICNREFKNRKKWKNVWDKVIYCSKKCRSAKNERTSSES